MKKETGYVYLQRKTKDTPSLRIPYEDAREKVTLTCLQEDIDNAVCREPGNCIMARMYKRAFGATLTEVRVGKTCTHVVMGTGPRMFSMRFDNKGKLKKAIDQFDRSHGSSGFKAGDTYTLYPPTASDRQGARPGRPYNRAGGKGTQKQLIERKAAIRPTRNVFCFISPKNA